MKKIFLLVFILLFNINFSEAGNIYERKLPDNFKKECFKDSTSYLFLNKNNGKYKIKINRADVIAVKGNYIIPIIPYKQLGEKISYNSNTFKSIKKINDDNSKTYSEITLEGEKSIILNFPKGIKKNSFIFKFKHSAKDYFPQIYISTNGTKYHLVRFDSISDFDFNYFKINFKPRNERNIKRELIKINELSFTKKNDIKLIKVEGGGKVDFYSGYDCSDYINLNATSTGFPIDNNTPEVNIKLEENSDYNPNIKKDTDVDGIDDGKDNCINIYNPLQKDTNADGIGDKCSDVDNDGIIGNEDNCPTISNSDQKDINLNGIGDVCEFDKDEDGIFDSIDNCITVKNSLQKDTDNDGIGDKCDNCEFFNPSQKDEDKNGFGDRCDYERKKIADNDDDLDGIINRKDNCRYISNSKQLDTDKDGIGDKCDNCLRVQNKSQLDFNKNNIGDICEDSDLDGIEGIKDNCINVANPNQKDSDNDGVGDLCEDDDNDEILYSLDNCPSVYNPLQKDTDNDGVGDKCDKEDDRFIESNKNFIIFIVLIIIALFGFGIYTMIRKLNSGSTSGN